VVLAAVLAGLQLTELITWSWWWATFPLWTAVGGAVPQAHARPYMAALLIYRFSIC
jgi:hypothetical protein